MNSEQLQQYSDAWNDHDIERIMSFMTDDCVFEPGGGPERFGTRFQGQAEVRERFIEVWTESPDIRFENGIHFAQGDYGCSEWTIVGTRTSGVKIEIDGCDLFTFENGKIASKRSYIKDRR